MTKANLIDQIAGSTQRTKREAEQLVDAVLNAIADSLGNGEKVDLRGFGSFLVNDKKERQGRNPKTGEALTIAARKVAVFKPSRELADRVNGTPAASSAASGGVPSAELSDGSAKLHGDKIDV
jgi:DNA-binding protein HU-beta